MDKDDIGIALMVIGLNIAIFGGAVLLWHMILTSDIPSNDEFNPYSGLSVIPPVVSVIVLMVGIIIFILGIKTYFEAEKEAKLRKKSRKRRYKRSHHRRR